MSNVVELSTNAEEAGSQLDLKTLLQQVDRKIIFRILKLGIPMSVADSYPFVMLALPYLLNKVHHSDKHQAAANALIITSIDVVLITTASSLFALRNIGSRLYGQYSSEELPLEIKEVAKNEIVRLFRNGSRIMIGTLPAAMGGLLIAADVAQALGEDKRTAKLAQSFLTPYTWIVLPPIMLSLLADQMLSNAQFITPMIASPINLIIGLCAAYLLGGRGPDYLQGNTGVLIGIAYIAYMMAAIYCGYIFFHPKFKSLELKKGLATLCSKKQLMDDLPGLKEIAAISAPLTLSIAAEMFNGWLLQLIAARIGTESQAAWSIAMICTLANISFIVNMALSGQIMVRSTMHNPRQITSNSLNGIIAASIVGGIVPVLFSLYPELLIRTNNPDDNIRPLIRQLIPILAVSSYLNSLCYAFLFQIRALGFFWTAAAIRFVGISLGLITANALSMSSLETRGVAWGDVLGKTVLLFLAVKEYTTLFKPYYHQAMQRPAQVNYFSVLEQRETGSTVIEIDEVSLEPQQEIITTAPSVANLSLAQDYFRRWRFFAEHPRTTGMGSLNVNATPGSS